MEPHLTVPELAAPWPPPVKAPGRPWRRLGLVGREGGVTDRADGRKWPPAGGRRRSGGPRLGARVRTGNVPDRLESCRPATLNGVIRAAESRAAATAQPAVTRHGGGRAGPAEAAPSGAPQKLAAHCGRTRQLGKVAWSRRDEFPRDISQAFWNPCRIVLLKGAWSRARSRWDRDHDGPLGSSESEPVSDSDSNRSRLDL